MSTESYEVPRSPRHRTGRPAPPAWWPARFYYGWALVGTLGLTETVSYGVLSYAFAVFIVPMTAELGWSKAALTGAFSLGALVAGLAALPVGRWVDRHGARSLMTAGSVLAALLLVTWSSVRSLWMFYVLWALMGLAMAAVLYEPAFAVIARWFSQRRGRALTVLSFIAGFASVIFVPLATRLVEVYGWRDALLWLAGVYAVLTIVPHALVLRRRPEDVGLLADGSSSIAASSRSREFDATARSPSAPPRRDSLPASAEASSAVRSRSFRWLATAFALSALTTTAVAVHLVPLLLERGYDSSFAGAAMGLLGLMALPGRLVFTPLGSRWPRPMVTAAIFTLGAVACVALLATRHAVGVWVFVVLFGAGFGAITPARAALVAELYGVAHYGRINGVLALVIAIARAAAPVGASLLYVAGGGARHGYDVVMVALVVLSLGSGVAMLAAGRREELARSALPQGL